MRTSIRIHLSAQESRELRLIVRREKAPYREGVRARLILLLAKGENFAAVSRTVGLARRIVYKWAKRFKKERLGGLKDKPRSGRPARFPPDRLDPFGKVGLRASG